MHVRKFYKYTRLQSNAYYLIHKIPNALPIYAELKCIKDKMFPVFCNKMSTLNCKSVKI